MPQILRASPALSVPVFGRGKFTQKSAGYRPYNSTNPSYWCNFTSSLLQTLEYSICLHTTTSHCLFWILSHKTQPDKSQPHQFPETSSDQFIAGTRRPATPLQPQLVQAQDEQLALSWIHISQPHNLDWLFLICLVFFFLM